MQNISSSACADTKPHYALLDGLRGVAALIVIWYHVFEGFAFAGSVTEKGDGLITTFNHGYLAVDFFFILSGFVIGYAYDDRWGTRLSLRGFFRRRLIRLHPMVVMGAVIGALCFAIGGYKQWDGAQMSISMVMVSLLMGLFLIPTPQGAPYEVRGNGEMFPLNGPSWSLFFEYIGNIFYALLLRRLSDGALKVVVVLLGIALAGFAVNDISGYGSIGVGWTLDWVNFGGGLLRMLFPFSMGLLISRRFSPVPVRGAFWICSVVLVVLFSVPFIPSIGKESMNGVFEAVCIIFVFPKIIRLAASGHTTDRFSTAVCRWLGDLSFPLYIIHYPLMYLFYAWLIETEQFTLGETWPVALAVVVGSILLAFALLKFYDEPVRRWLNGRYNAKNRAKR